MKFDDILVACAEDRRRFYIDETLDDLLQEIAGAHSDWEEICDEINPAPSVMLESYADHIRHTVDDERDTPHHRRVWDTLWARAVNELENAVERVEARAEEDAGDDEIADELREAFSQTSYSPKTNETLYPAKFAGYEVGRGTGLAEDCTTSCYYDRRVMVAAQWVASFYDVEISDCDCDTLENAAEAIRQAIQLEPASAETECA